MDTLNTLLSEVDPSTRFSPRHLQGLRGLRFEAPYDFRTLSAILEVLDFNMGEENGIVELCFDLVGDFHDGSACFEEPFKLIVDGSNSARIVELRGQIEAYPVDTARLNRLFKYLTIEEEM